MIHYHGTPLTPEAAAAQVLKGRHAFVSFEHPEQLPLVAGVCQSFALDNGAFSAWRAGRPVEDWEPFYAWVRHWWSHPGFDWFLIPDVIDGDEDDNDELISECFARVETTHAVPVWHLHESLGRLETLCLEWSRIALGSSGTYRDVDSSPWWRRMSEVMEVVCPKGSPIVRLHGLRMLDPAVFTRFPFASADSTNVARNVGLDQRWRGTYAPTNPATRGEVLASRIEEFQSPAIWTPDAQQQTFELAMTEGFA